MVSEIVNHYSDNIYFSNHAMKEMAQDNLTSIDIWNVLKSLDSRIFDEGELKDNSYRYRLETHFLVVVISFDEKGEGLNIVTVWDKRNKNKE